MNSVPLAFERRPTGRFDLPAARELCDSVIAAGRAHVVIDLTHATEVHDDALALLARAVRLLGRRASVRGLTRRHLRVLEYLGGPVVARRAADPAED